MRRTIEPTSLFDIRLLSPVLAIACACFLFHI
jgi:hypothetical protein